MGSYCSDGGWDTSAWWGPAIWWSSPDIWSPHGRSDQSVQRHWRAAAIGHLWSNFDQRLVSKLSPFSYTISPFVFFFRFYLCYHYTFTFTVSLLPFRLINRPSGAAAVLKHLPHSFIHSVILSPLTFKTLLHPNQKSRGQADSEGFGGRQLVREGNTVLPVT